MAEYILDTTDGILHSRTTGELIRCRDCVKGRLRKSDGLYECEFWTAFVSRTVSLDGDEYCSEGERRHDGTRD